MLSSIASRLINHGGKRSSLYRSMPLLRPLADQFNIAACLSNNNNYISHSNSPSHNHQQTLNFHSSSPVLGFEEFTEPKKANEVVSSGRSWKAPELRRKSFDDLHKLWFLLYKERNLLLSEKAKRQRLQRPPGPGDELRYACVKRSMGAIKFVLRERRKIYRELNAKEAAENASTIGADEADKESSSTDK